MQTIQTVGVPIKLWLEAVEPEALRQARDIAALPFAFKHVAIMPDCHTGFGMPIGGVLAARDFIVPNAVGVDIGCGVRALKFNNLNRSELELEDVRHILTELRALIPVGFAHHNQAQNWQGFSRPPDSAVIQRELESARRQLGTLGGGNHFIELQTDDDGAVYAMIHSGSRNFGFKVAADYQKRAVAACEKQHRLPPQKDLASLAFDSREGQEYYCAMNFCLDFARENRRQMMETLVRCVQNAYPLAQAGEVIDVHHNYAALETHFGLEVLVHRKGAIRAAVGEPGIVPGSMGSPSYITRGLGNPESFLSSSHGAGRKMGRKQAMLSLDLAAEQQRMRGIAHSLRSKRDLDEAPSAYKDIEAVMRNQQDLTKIMVHLTPLGVIKG